MLRVLLLVAAAARGTSLQAGTKNAVPEAEPLNKGGGQLEGTKCLPHHGGD